MKIKKGDTVIVMSGKDKGKTSTVVRAFPRLGKVLVEGVNMKKVHQRKGKANTKGQVVEKAAPFDVSNVMIADPKTKKPTRVRFVREGGKKLRVAAKSGAKIS